MNLAKNLYTEDTESIPVDDRDDGLARTPLSAPVVFPYGAWSNTSTGPEHLSLNVAAITTNTGAKRTT